jgi:hypothetical protein
VDCACAGDLLHARFAKGIPRTPTKTRLLFADGRVSGPTSTAKITVQLHDVHGDPWNFVGTFVITDEIAYDIICGLPWLRSHNPTIDWKSLSFTLADGRRFAAQQPAIVAAVKQTTSRRGEGTPSAGHVTTVDSRC